ncbi:MAG: tetratricopeptide repeat protein [Chitinophagaceae bacterium]|nr:tetratricopeptide repeat protein [Chitinophagaceae bacterium]
MKNIWLFLLSVGVSLATASQEAPCSSIIAPSIPETTRKEYELKRASAKEQFEKNTANADAMLWYGRRTAYTGRYMEAISVFSNGIALHPDDARFYRHRGHRYITVRCFDKAIADLEEAARLVKGQPDETEPDGLPNAKNIPTSTLQSNIWYHLGLAYYSKGEYAKAANAYRQCLKVSTNNDMYVATANWYHITLLRLGKKKKAKQLLDSVDPSKELIENKEYLDILMLYKREADFADPLLLLEENNTLRSSTYGYGVAMYCLLKQGGVQNARKVLEKIVSGNQWASFGFIAAEAELAKMK